MRERVHAGFKVLDAGCGPGTFAKVLLELGARVTCLDISEVQLQACREQAAGCESYELGSITDLSRFPNDAFDLTLALGGVLSYCFEQSSVAVKELMRVSRPGGLVGLSVMNLYGTVHHSLSTLLRTPVPTSRRILATGDLNRADYEGHECHMFRVDELRSLLAYAGLTDLEFSAEGWLVSGNETEMPEVGSEAWTLLLEAEAEASRESPGAGTRIIAWGRIPA